MRLNTEALKLLVVVGLTVFLSSSELSASPETREDPANSVDWSAVSMGDPIPEELPSGESNDPQGSGFYRQWVEHSLQPLSVGTNKSSLPLILAIISKQRAPGDLWASNVEDYLRGYIRREIDSKEPVISRVFCNSIGCLCYLERRGHLDVLLMYHALERDAGRTFGITKQDLDSIRSTTPDSRTWELTIVKRPAGL